MSLKLIKAPNVYNYDLRIAYVNYGRKLSKKLKVSLRTLDRALWQYSKEKKVRDLIFK
jgi:hypothetical protein